jgi:segregation and condensation protein B
MSLKAKLEAVIYAAEEPVTLAQLASLFAEDAFAWKAEQAAAAQEAAEPSPELEPDLVPDLEPNLAADAEITDAPAPLSDSSSELSDLVDVVEDASSSELDADAGTQAVAHAERRQEFAGDSEPKVTTDPGSDAATEIATADATLTSGETAASESAAVEPVVDPVLEAKRQERRREREVREILRTVLDELVADYASENRGIEIREIAGGFRMGTKPEIHDTVRYFVRSLKPALKLSLPALETLAVIAYKQPVTAPEVGEIRGVDSAGVLGSLMSRKLITTAGRKQVIGRPMLYKTTKEFLLRFGLKDVNELPSMEEFEKIAALELSETEEAEAEGEREAAAENGELFVEAAETTEGPLETGAPETEEQEVEAVSTPTAEPSQEAAEEPALVERQNAEEEVEAGN